MATYGAAIKKPEEPTTVLPIQPCEESSDPLDGSSTPAYDYQPVQDGQRMDVWEDDPILQYRRHQKLPTDPIEGKHVRKRAAHY